MDYQAPKKIDTPDFRLIKRCLNGNSIFKDNDVEIILNVNDSQNDCFEISLSAKKKDTDVSFRVETRVAIEQHSTLGHLHPHLQINNFASNEELMKKGRLHITLLVQSKDELEECCNGFMYNISEIINLIENTFEINKNLNEFFFNSEPLNTLSKYSNKLHELIYHSFKINKLKFEDNEIELIQFKGKKNDPTFDTKDNFKILRILLQLKFLNPIILDPLLKLINEDPKIKNKCPNLNQIKCKEQLLNKKSSDLIHYTVNEHIKDNS